MSFTIEKICSMEKWKNESGSMWSGGNSILLRVGERVYAVANRVIDGRMPHANTSLELYEKKGNGPWKSVFFDEGKFQREPCQILYLGDERLAVFTTPTIEACPPEQSTFLAPSVPLAYVFDIAGEVRLVDTIVLPWEKEYPFKSHTYRGAAIDAVNGNIYCDSLYYSEEVPDGEYVYSLMDHDFKPIRMGKLYGPDRALYHNIATKDNETYVFGLAGVHETNPEWIAYKEKMGGFAYVFQKLYMWYSPNLAEEDFPVAKVVCDMSGTSGRSDNYDCCFDANGDMLFLVGEYNIDEAYMRDRFFPEMQMEFELVLYRYSHGELKERTVIERATDVDGKLPKYGGFIHTAADGERYIVWTKSTDTEETEADTDGKLPGTATYLIKVSEPTEKPVKLMDCGDRYYRTMGNKTRLGAAPGDIVDICWSEFDNAIMYATGRIPQ